MKILKKIELDFARNTNDVTVYAKQYDVNSRFLVITPLDKGQRKALEEGTKARLQLTKADGNTIINDAVITDDGLIVAELTMQALLVSGKACAEIALYKDNSVLSSQTFCINVDKAAYDESAPKSTSEYESLTDTLIKADTAAESAEKAAQKADEITKKAEGLIDTLKNLGETHSISVNVISDDVGHRVIITDKDGDKEFVVTDGADGSDGPAGISPHLKIGTVETLSSGTGATATLSGTDEFPILNLGIPKGEDGDTANAIPSYVQDEIDSVTDEVLKLQNKNVLRFIAVADFHELTGNNNIETSNKHAGMSACAIGQSINFDFGAVLGDLTGDVKTNEIMRINRYINDAFSGIPNFRTPGDHDYMTYNFGASGRYINEHQVYALFGKYNDGAVFDEPNRVRGYCYRDFDSQKVRVICLNTADMKGLTINTKCGIERISPQQLKWFAQTLDMSEKQDAEQWGILILSHHPLDWGSIMPAAGILNAYVNGDVFSIVHENIEISYDFEGKNKAEVICQVHGHIHNYKVGYIRADEGGTLTKVKRIAVPNACYLRNNIFRTDSVFGEPFTYTKIAGQANDTAFNIITIDRDEKKIYCINYGTGVDRIVEYGV